MYQLTIEKKQFTNEQNEQLDYYRFSSDVDGETIVFNLSKQDKRLVSHILETEDLSNEKLEIPLTVENKYGKYVFSFELQGELFYALPREEDIRLVKFLFSKNTKK